MIHKNLPESLSDFLNNRYVTGKSGKQHDSLQSGSTLNNLVNIYQIINRYKPKTTLEIGMAYAKSTLTFAFAHNEISGKASKQHYALDPFQSTQWDNGGVLELEKAELSNYVSFFEEKSSIRLPKLLESNMKFDLIYIDGSHLFENAFIDFYYSAQLLNKNGIILFDDCRDKEVHKVIRFIEKNLNRQFREINLEEFNKRKYFEKVKYKIAKILNQVQMRGYQKISDESLRKYGSRFENF